MRIGLVYSRQRAQVNQWLINRYLDCGKSQGLEVDLIFDDEPMLREPDCFIVRTMNPIFSQAWENRGFPVFNPAKTSRIANNKWLTHQFVRSIGIQTMDTSLALEREYPYVIKPVDGHGGDGVALITNDYDRARYTIDPGRTYITQEVADTLGQDVRLYVLNYTIVAAMKRDAHGKFLANFTKGATAERMTPDDEMERIVSMLSPHLGPGLYGIDVLHHHNSWVLNEVEDVVGTRMLYFATDIDIVDEHLRVVVEETARLSQEKPRGKD